MSERPKIKIELTWGDKIIEILGWVSILVFWAFMITYYSKLPNIIPTHFNGAGEVDGYGHKASILILPIISTVIFISITVLNNFPHIFNFPTEITDDNALSQYTNATRMLRYLKLTILIIFGFIAFKAIQNTNGEGAGIGKWFIPVSLVLIFMPLFYYLIKSFLAKRG
jgi:uncharacterized membrane protein